LLKVLEDETDLDASAERVLPELADNIKCGNSLVSTDIFELRELSTEVRDRLNPFDWVAEFEEIMRGGGFDAVIGNPPYIFTRELITDIEREYYASNYQFSRDKHNTYVLFMELALRLLNDSGRGSFIVPNSWLTIESCEAVREHYVPRLCTVIDLNYQVFRGVGMEPSIFVVEKGECSPKVVAARASVQT
jgi:hypothetical protein